MSGRGFRPARHGRDLQGALQSAVQDIVSSVIDHVEASTSLTTLRLARLQQPTHSVRIDDSTTVTRWTKASARYLSSFHTWTWPACAEPWT